VCSYKVPAAKTVVRSSIRERERERETNNGDDIPYR